MNIDIKKILGEVSNNNSLDDQDYIVIDGVTYMFVEVENETTTHEGKYMLGANIYKLMIYDKDCNTTSNTGLFFRQSFTKYGEHWSGYEFEYDDVTQVVQKQRTITYWAEVV